MTIIAPGLEVCRRTIPLRFRRHEHHIHFRYQGALTDAKYIVNSGGAARKAGMTREDLLKGNAAIAEEFGKM